MPEVIGEWLESGKCSKNQKDFFPSYDMYGINEFKRKVMNVRINLEGRGSLIYNVDLGVVYSDTNGNGIIEDIKYHFSAERDRTWLDALCPELKLD